MDSDTEAVSSLSNSLKMLQKLKVSLHALFDSVGNGPTEGQDNQSYLLGIQQLLINMDMAFTDLENSASSLPAHNPQPSNSMCITLEPENDNYEVFQQLTNTYTWSKRMQEYATHVHTTLKDNQLKRTVPSTGFTAKRTKRTYPDVHSVPPQKVDEIIDKISQALAQKTSDLTVTIARPFGISTVLVISIARALKAIVILRGLIAERIIVKGFGEPTNLENGQVDIWSESKYKVFRLVTQSAQSALLQYYSPNQPDAGLYYLVHWLHSYSNLFSGECQYCGKILKDNVPPTGRSFDKGMTRYHPQCSSSQAR